MCITNIYIKEKNSNVFTRLPDSGGHPAISKHLSCYILEKINNEPRIGLIELAEVTENKKKTKVLQEPYKNFYHASVFLGE